MLRMVTVEMLLAQLTRDHGDWAPAQRARRAQEIMRETHELLDAPLYDFLTTGQRTDFRFGEFSVLQIQMMEPSRSYLDAVGLMTEYMRDPKLGRSLILRHW